MGCVKLRQLDLNREQAGGQKKKPHRCANRGGKRGPTVLHRAAPGSVGTRKRMGKRPINRRREKRHSKRPKGGRLQAWRPIRTLIETNHKESRRGKRGVGGLLSQSGSWGEPQRKSKKSSSIRPSAGLASGGSGFREKGPEGGEKGSRW